MVVALTISGSFSIGSLLLFLALILLLNLRQKYSTTFQLALTFFVFYYLITNFALNMFDFCWNYLLKGVSYKFDDDFVSAFSYKTHQLLLIIELSFVSAHFMRPNAPIFKEIPLLLTLIHLSTLVVSGSMFYNFLYELTSMSTTTRFKVYRSEIVKVFMTLVIFYFLSLCFTSWLHKLMQFVQD